MCAVKSQQSNKIGLGRGEPDKPSKFSALGGFGKIAGFFCLVMVLSCLVDRFINEGLRQIQSSGFGVWNNIVEGKINAEILILGSSRALTHYDPRIIQERTGRTAYNIGLNGSQTDMQVARFKTYLQHNKKPTLLIFNLDLFSFQVTHGGAYDPGQYLPYINEPDLYAALERINPEWWKTKAIPLYGYAVEDLRFTWILGVISRFKANAVEDHFLGFKPRATQWTGDFERFKAMNPKGIDFEIEPEGIREMEGLLQLCQQQGIKVLLVYSPEYREIQALTNNRLEVFAKFDGLSKKFRVPVWDYSGSPISSRKEYFYNSQHLNTDGALQFSLDFAAKLATDPEVAKLLASH